MASFTVITGGSGFLGSHLAEALVGRGEQVVVVDVRPPPPEVGPVEWVCADVRDEAAVAAAVDGAAVVHHLASVVGVEACLRSPREVIDVAVAGTRNVLAAADRAGASVVVVSTSEVVGRSEDQPFDEDADRVLGSTTKDRWAYASAKGVAEHLAMAWHREAGVDVSVVRPFNVYGPRQGTGFVVVEFLRALLAGRAVPIHGDGRDRRCFTFVDDVVEGLLAVADHPEAAGEVFNLGSNEEVSVSELADRAASVLGVEARIEMVASESLGTGFAHISRRVPAVEKAGTVLGWKATTPLDEGLALTAAWLRDRGPEA